jgi:polyhydroxyalkanoate synthesis regulator protein
MQNFTKNQSQMRDYFRSTFGGVFTQTFEEMSKQNMAIFEQAMNLFSPFAAGGMNGPTGTAQPEQRGNDEPPQEKPEAPASNFAPHLRPVNTPAPAAAAPAAAPTASAPAAPSTPPAPKADGSIEIMQNRLDELQKQIASLSKGDETR